MRSLHQWSAQARQGVGTVFCDSEDINKWLVLSGFAIAASGNQYRSAEKWSRKRELGVWGYCAGARRRCSPGTSSIRCIGSGWWNAISRSFRENCCGARRRCSTDSCRSRCGSWTAECLDTCGNRLCTVSASAVAAPGWSCRSELQAAGRGHGAAGPVPESSSTGRRHVREARVGSAAGEPAMQYP